MRSIHRTTWAAAMVVTLWSVAWPAGADATVVSETTMSGIPGRSGNPEDSWSKPVRATVRYRGGAMRTDSPEGAVIATARRMIFIDDAARKWSATSPGKAAGGADALLKMVDMKTDATVRSTGKTTTLLGRPAKQWVVDAVIRMKIPDVSAMMGGGGESRRTPSRSRPPPSACARRCGPPKPSTWGERWRSWEARERGLERASSDRWSRRCGRFPDCRSGS